MRTRSQEPACGIRAETAYDTRNRLTNLGVTGTVSGAPGSIASYDPVGNRTQKVSTLPGFPGGLLNYNANDELATDAYDANGNTVGSGANTGSNGYVSTSRITSCSRAASASSMTGMATAPRRPMLAARCAS
jgi:hypothetical protein